jgi:hypothetical protein
VDPAGSIGAEFETAREGHALSRHAGDRPRISTQDAVMQDEKLGRGQFDHGFVARSGGELGFIRK